MMFSPTYDCSKRKGMYCAELECTVEERDVRGFPSWLLERQSSVASVPVLIVARYRWILVVHVGGHSTWMAVERAGVYFLAEEDPTKCQ